MSSLNSARRHTGAAEHFAGVFSTRLGAPLLVVFLGLGMLAGEEGLSGIVFRDFHAAYLIGSISLAIILFDGGIRTDPGATGHPATNLSRQPALSGSKASLLNGKSAGRGGGNRVLPRLWPPPHKCRSLIALVASADTATRSRERLNGPLQRIESMTRRHRRDQAISGGSRPQWRAALSPSGNLRSDNGRVSLALDHLGQCPVIGEDPILAGEHVASGNWGIWEQFRAGLSATEISMISWSRVALVIKFAALAASLHLEPSGLGNKRIALAAEITNFETALDSHAKSRSKKTRTGPRTVDASAPVS
jgi:hypothetical protein